VTCPGPDPFLVLKCESEVVKSPVLHNTLDPVWNFSAIFYRKKPEKLPLKIQVKEI
jgi:calpain-5